MLREVSELGGYSLRAMDGDVGTLEDVFFSDRDWRIRYLVVDTGPWLRSRRVLVSPLSVTEVRREEKSIIAQLTREQVQSSPEIDAAKPVSRQYEIDYSRHYGLPFYWAGGSLWNPMPPPDDLANQTDWPSSPEPSESGETVHLRSSHEVRGYRFEGQEGELGHIKDFILDDETWLIRYVEIDTRNWWPGGKKVLLARQWIDEVRWDERKVTADVHRSTVKEAPPYDESGPITEAYEIELFKHYGREVNSA